MTYGNCLLALAVLWLRHGGRVVRRRSCAGPFTHYMIEGRDGVLRQFIPLHYERRRFPRLLFSGRVITGDAHGRAHAALAAIGYPYGEIDGLQPSELIELLEREIQKIGGDW